MAACKSLFVALMLVVVSTVAGDVAAAGPTLLTTPPVIPPIPVLPPILPLLQVPVIPPIPTLPGIPQLTLPFPVQNRVCTSNSQCGLPFTCKGCPPCPGQIFKGTCLGPNDLIGCSGCPVTPPGVDGTPCTRDSQCGAPLKCATCGGGGCFAGNLENRGGECKPANFDLLCACP